MPDIGPQNPKDPPFTARMRLHQSWYRARVLSVPYGTGPKQGNKTFYGNMLTQGDGARGLNFLTPHIFSIAKRRLAEKNGQIDGFSLLCNMLSSHALCFNLFGPLVDDRELAADLLPGLVHGEAGRVQRVRLAYAPEPAGEFLNDPTGFDVFIEYEESGGSPAFIGIDTQLTKGSSVKASIQPVYWKWTKREGSPWPESGWPLLIDSEVNPLWRGHLLEQAMTHRPGSRYTAGQFLVLYHPLDGASMRSIEAYQRLIKPEAASFSALPLDRLVSRWRAAVVRNADREWLAEFERRYLDFSASDGELPASR